LKEAPVNPIEHPLVVLPRARRPEDGRTAIPRRSHGRAAWVLVLPLASLLAACASSPPAPTASCSNIAAEIDRTQASLSAARQKQEQAWKAVVPFAVAGRYVSGKAAAGQAQERIEVLSSQQARQGCEAPAGS